MGELSKDRDDMRSHTPFCVTSGDEFSTAQLVDVLAQAYGQPFTEDWLRWKHREGPWGPSRCWVAVDDAGILGLVFGLPWTYRVGSESVRGSRLVDGGSTPRARGRGVFQAVVAEELRQWDADTSPGIVLATATPEAAGAHAKNGATVLDPIDYAYGPAPRLSRARLHRGLDVLDTYRSDDRGTFHTDWDPATLRWRIDPRSGHAYHAASLAGGSDAHGAIYRVVTVKGVRVLVVALTWGDTRDVRELLGALAWHERTPALLGPAGPGAAPRPWPTWIRRNSALLCVWPEISAPLAQQSRTRDGWSLSGIDVEGVI